MAERPKVRADLRGWEAVRKAIVKTEKRVKVGILTDEKHEARDLDSGDEDEASEISMLELAAIHEFGAPAAGIPERSFLRATIDGKRDEVNKAIEELVGKEVERLLGGAEGKDVSEAQADAAAKRALGKLGLQLVAMIRATIRNRETVGPEDQALKQETIDRKGSSLPLVDTGQLINAVDWALVDKGDEE